MSTEQSSPIFPDVQTDDTLPQDCVKLVSGGRAVVFQLDFNDESAQVIAEWEE